MNKNEKRKKILSNIYFSFFIFFFLIAQSKSFKYYKAFTLLSKNILIISDEGIIKYNPSTKQQAMIQSSNLISSRDDLNFISFTQSPSDEGGYIFCRFRNYIYILDDEQNNLIIRDILKSVKYLIFIV